MATLKNIDNNILVPIFDVILGFSIFLDLELFGGYLSAEYHTVQLVSYLETYYLKKLYIAYLTTILSRVRFWRSLQYMHMFQVSICFHTYKQNFWRYSSVPLLRLKNPLKLQLRSFSFSHFHNEFVIESEFLYFLIYLSIHLSIQFFFVGNMANIDCHLLNKSFFPGWKFEKDIFYYKIQGQVTKYSKWCII